MPSSPAARNEKATVWLQISANTSPLVWTSDRGSMLAAIQQRIAIFIWQSKTTHRPISYRHWPILSPISYHPSPSYIPTPQKGCNRHLFFPLVFSRFRGFL